MLCYAYDTLIAVVLATSLIGALQHSRSHHPVESPDQSTGMLMALVEQVNHDGIQPCKFYLLNS